MQVVPVSNIIFSIINPKMWYIHQVFSFKVMFNVIVKREFYGHNIL
jgi:hypothetical protein